MDFQIEEAIFCCFNDSYNNETVSIIFLKYTLAHSIFSLLMCLLTTLAWSCLVALIKSYNIQTICKDFLKFDCLCAENKTLSSTENYIVLHIKYMQYVTTYIKYIYVCGNMLKYVIVYKMYVIKI